MPRLPHQEAAPREQVVDPPQVAPQVVKPKRQSTGPRSKKVEAASKAGEAIQLDDETKIERMAFNAQYYESLQHAMDKIEANAVFLNIRTADALPIKRVLGEGTTGEGYQDGQCENVYLSACSIYTHAHIEEVKP